jgi:hypothetical protein
VNIFDPNLQVPYSDTWTVGFQRSLGQKQAIEIRYVGTRSRQQWENFNYNEADILNNKFLDEFKLAQANLQSTSRPVAVARRTPARLLTGVRAPARRRSRSIWRSSARSGLQNAGNAALYTSTTSRARAS